MSKLPLPTPSRRILSSASSTALAIMLATAGTANSQTVTTQNDDEIITLAAPVTVADNPVVVVANNDVTVNNNTTLSTTGVTQTIQVDAPTTGAIINNSAGRVIQAESRAINVDGDDVTINNFGTILGTGNQRNGTIYGNRTSNGLVINNAATGIIDAGVGNQGAGIAIEVGGGGAPITGSITNAGIIQGRGQAAPTGGTAGDGLRFFGPGLAPVYQYNGTITNSGTIASESAVGTTAGVRFANRINFGGTLENTATGTISGVNNGLYFGEADHTGGTVLNDGTISSDSRALNIDGTGLEILNRGQIIGTGNQRNGTVYADSTAQDFVLNNEGTIDAGAGNEGAGFSAELSAAGNGFIINNTSTGVIQGRGQAGAGAAGAGDGIRFERERVAGMLDGSTTGLFTGDINNTGLINSESTQGTAAGIRFVNGVSFSGTINNGATGIISGAQNGLYFGNATPAGGGDFTGAVVDNAGTISSDSRAVNIDGTGLTLNNTGDILGTGAQRNGTVYSDGTATDFTVNNSGTIDAVVSGSGFAAEIQATGNTFTFDNSGTIQGRGQGDAATGAAGDGFRIGNVGNAGLATVAITNSGLIASESAVGTTAGLRIVNGISAAGTITNSGTITGVQNGLYLGNSTPAGDADFSDLVITNTSTGTISSGSRAVNIDGTGVTLINEGDILGTGVQRNGTVYSDGTATDFTVNNSGTIDAVVEGSGFAAEIGADGNTFTFDNSGTLQGRGDVENADGFRVGNPGNIGTATVTITNSGTINSESNQGTTAGLRFVNGIDFAGTIENSGTISGVRNGVYFGNPVAGEGADHSNGVFTNTETGVISSDSRAFNIDGLGLTLNNAGSILGTGAQRNGTVYSDGTAQNFTVNNSGTIDAGETFDGSGFAAEIDGENTFTFDNSGTIQGRGQGAFSDGFRVGNGGNTGIATANITNSGTISSESTGSGAVSGFRVVNGVTLNGTLTNTDTGVISGAQNGVYFGTGDHSNAVVDNAGTISSDSRALNIDGTGLTVNNSGSILGTSSQRNGTVYADSTAQDFTLNNTTTGVIDAGEGNEGAGFSVELSAAGNAFDINNAGTIQGRGQAGAGAAGAGDGLRFERTRVAGMLDGSTTGLFTGNIVNSGTIASESAQGTAAGIRFVNGVSFSGTIENSGTISGVQNGLYFGNPTPAGGGDFTGAVVNNLASGVISSDSRAFNIDGLGLTVNNAGSILGTGDQRNGTLYADGTATDFTVNNSGTIDAGAGNIGSGFAAEVAPTGNSFTFDNSGTLQGRGQGSAATGAAGDGFRIGNVGNSGLATVTITNSGTIDSESAVGTTAGLRIVNGISAAGTLDNSGTISGVQNGLYFGNATPAGGGDFTNFVVNNSGTISSGSRALNIDGLGLTVNNSGNILGTGDQRNGTVYSDATADQYTLNNLAGGVIDAGLGNNGSGVSLQSGNVDGETVSFTLTNAGTIAGRGTELTPAGLRIFNGAADVTVNGDITNSGTISSENAAAILIQNVDFAGTITNSGTLSGTAVLDASTATGGVTFNQIGGAFEADFIGSAFDDALSISGPSFGLNADILGGVETSIDAASTTVSGARSLEGNLTSNGNLTFDLGVDSLAVDGNTTFGADSTVTITTNSNINDITLNSPITVISETGTFTDNGLSVNVIDDDFLVDYQVELGSVVVTATAADLSNVSTDTNLAGFASAVGTAFAAGQLADAAANTFNAATSNADFEGSVISALPTLNEGVSRETWETHSRTARYVSDRLASDAPGGAWVQASTRSADLDAESLSVEGYGADTTAVTFGYDREVSEAFRLGASFTFADSDIDDDVNDGETNELNTNQIAVYAGYDAGDIFVSGQVGYVFGDGDSERITELGTVTSEYDVSGFTAQATAAYDLGVLKPEAGLRYGSISQDDFTETGGLNLNVDVDTVNYLEAAIGASVSPELDSFGSWTVQPTARANYVYDLISDSRDVAVTLAGAPSQLLSSGDASGSRFEIGAGVDFVSTSGVAIGIAYEGDFASGYSSNAGLLRARIGF